MIKLLEIIDTTPGLDYHLKNNLPICENVYRYSSESFVNLFGEARELWKQGKIELPLIDVELLEATDIGKWGLYEGTKVPLDLPLLNEEDLDEAEYKGKDVPLNKPKRGGPKKFYVYVKNKKGNVVKVNFGAEGGGQNLSVKLDDPKRRKAFSDRHNCKDKTDKTSPGYWSCRLTRYAKSLGMKKNYSGYW